MSGFTVKARFFTAPLALCAAAAATLAGCTPDKGAPPDAVPGETARNAAANIDKQIEKIKNDQSMPAEAKTRAIEGLERGKAAMQAEAARKQAPPSAPADTPK